VDIPLRVVGTISFLAQFRCFPVEENLLVAFGEPEDGSHGQESVKDGQDPKQPAPADRVCDDTAEDGAEGRTE
jgi:hypothetical protein